MHLLPDPRRRIRELAARNRTTLAALSRILGRPDHYLSRYCREGFPERLAAAEHDVLSRFFGVPVTEIGGDDPRWARWHDHGARTSDRKLGFAA